MGFFDHDDSIIGFDLTVTGKAIEWMIKMVKRKKQKNKEQVYSSDLEVYF